MGFKKLIMKSHCEDDLGYRIPHQRKGKEGKKQSQTASKRQPNKVTHTDVVKTFQQDSVDPTRSSISDSMDIDTRRVEKRLELSRRNQRQQKYSESFESESEEESVSNNRKPSPLSPPNLWKITGNTDICSPSRPNKSNHSPDVLPSPFRKTLADGMLSPGKHRYALENSLDSVKRTISFDIQKVSLVDELCDELTILSRCACILYDLLFHYEQQGHNFSVKLQRWDDADSDDEQHDVGKITPVDRMWFTGTFLNLIRNTTLAKNIVNDLISSLSMVVSPSLHELFGIINEDFVIETFLMSSSFFVSRLVEEMIIEDDRVTSVRVPILQALYQGVKLSSDNGNKIRQSILLAVYTTTYSRLQRCIVGEKLSRMAEVDLNHLANHRLLDNIVSSKDNDAILTTLNACDTSRPTSKPNATEENAGYRILDHLSSIMQLLKFICVMEIGYVSLPGFLCRLDYLMKIVMNLYRSYGSPLGAVTGALESPVLQANLLSILFQLIHLIKLTDKQESLMNDILKEFLRYWPKGMFIRELSFIDALVAVLTARPLPVTARVRRDNNFLATNTLSFTLSQSYPERAINRLLLSCESPHFKVSNRATLSFQSPILLQFYFISSDTDDEILSEAKEEFMEKLVLCMRSNRTHWHPAIQQAAAATYDFVFQYFS